MRLGIVGAGLFGCIIARHLMGLGHSVCIMDPGLEGSGSKPAACLMKPGWMSKVPELDKCLQLLDHYYKIQDIKFNVNGLLDQTVHWVNPKRVLGLGHIYPVIVKSVNQWNGEVETNREKFQFDHVIVAAGVWTRDLCPWVDVQPRWGLACLWPEHAESVFPPFISQWAPYRQIVAFQRGDGLWAGDGSALKSLDYGQKAIIQQRIQNKVEINETPKLLIGARPYCKPYKAGDPCYLEHREKVTVASGGAKNGTIAAAWCALKIGEYLDVRHS